MGKILLIWVLLLFLLLTGMSLVGAGQIEETPEPISAEKTATIAAEATPTIDRLAAPPTVYPPTQADEGAQLFWLYCQPCHGDQGQGLTDEWRSQYVDDHQNCWLGGCHDKSPYPEGFALPTTVPAVIGDGSLFRFATMGQVFYYISAEMPFEHPGVLTDEEYLAITAFLARSHDAWDGTRLTVDNVEQVRLRPLPLVENEAQANQPEGEVQQRLSGTPVPKAENGRSGQNTQAVDDSLAWIGIILTLILVGGGWIWLRLK
jgi:hypothetical protein